MSQRMKRIFRIIIMVILGMVILAYIGYRIYEPYAKEQRHLENQISSLNLSNVYSHVDDIGELRMCTATILGRKSLLTDAERIKIVQQLNDIAEHEYMEQCILAKEYNKNVLAYEYEDMFDDYIYWLIKLLENEVITDEGYAYVSSYHQTLNDLYDLLIGMIKNVRYESKLEKDHEKGVEYQYFYKGKLVYEYINSSYSYFEKLWGYEDYIDSVSAASYHATIDEEEADIELTQEDIRAIKDEVLRRLTSIGYMVVEEEIDWDVEIDEDGDEVFSIEEELPQYNNYDGELTLSYQGIEIPYFMRIDPTKNYCDLDIDEDLRDYEVVYTYDALLEEIYKTADIFSDFELKNSSISDSTYNLSEVYISFNQCIGNYYDVEETLYVKMNYYGIITSLKLGYLEQYLDDFDINSIDVSMIDENIKRLEPYLDSEILDMLIDMTVIKDRSDRLLYQLELKNMDSTVYYYIDYETFEFVEVRHEGW